MANRTVSIVNSASSGDCFSIAVFVKIDGENTTITEGAGDAKAIDGRCNLIRREITTTDSEYDKEKLQERLAKLSGGVGIIRVGAPTEIEMKEKKDRVDDSVHATKAAVEEGILPGGGVSFIRCIPILEKLATTLKNDEKVGVEILIKAISAPLRWTGVPWAGR